MKNANKVQQEDGKFIRWNFSERFIVNQTWS